MMSPLDVFSEPVGQRLTWTLLHFLWQGLTVAVLLAAVLRLFPVRQARSRYALCLAAMLTMAACPPVTFALLGANAAEVRWGTAQSSPTVPSPEVVRHPSLPAPRERKAVEGIVVAQGPIGLRGETMLGDRAAADRPIVSADQPVAAQEVRLRPSLSLLRHFTDVVQPYLLAGWIAGVVMLAGRLLLGQVGVQWVRRGRRPISAELVSRVARLGERLGLRSVPGVFASAKVREAVVVGLLRPMVLLPACWLTEMTPEVLEAVVAHELAHIQRWDLWVNLLQRLVETLLFYHPAVWWLSRRVRLEREMCCDELAVAATGERMAYATALSQAARRRAVPNKPLLGAAIGGTEMTLLSRVHNVLGLSPGRERARWWPAGLLALLVPLGIWFGSISPGLTGEGEKGAQERAPDSQETRLEAQTDLPAPPAEAVGRGETKTAPTVTPQSAPYRVEPFDLLTIKVLGTLLDYPIDRVRLVEPSGQVTLGPPYGRVQLKGLTLEEAENAIKTQLKKILASPKVQVTSAGRVTRWRSAVLPEGPYRIQPNQSLAIRVTGTLLDLPIDGTYTVESAGQVPFGPAYGRVRLSGLTLEQAEDAVEKHLHQFLRKPEAFVAVARWRALGRDVAIPGPTHRIVPGELVEIEQILVGTIRGTHRISGVHLVDMDGKVALEGSHGTVEIKGLTPEEAETAIETYLKKTFRDAAVSVTLPGWKAGPGELEELKETRQTLERYRRQQGNE